MKKLCIILAILSLFTAEEVKDDFYEAFSQNCTGAFKYGQTFSNEYFKKADYQPTVVVNIVEKNNIDSLLTLGIPPYIVDSFKRTLEIAHNQCTPVYQKEEIDFNDYIAETTVGIGMSTVRGNYLKFAYIQIRGIAVLKRKIVKNPWYTIAPGFVNTRFPEYVPRNFEQRELNEIEQILRLGCRTHIKVKLDVLKHVFADVSFATKLNYLFDKLN